MSNEDNKKSSLHDSTIEQQNATPSDSHSATFDVLSNSKPRSFMHSVRAVFSALLLVLWILVMFFVFFVFYFLFTSRMNIFYKLFHRVCCCLFSMNVSTEGTMSVTRPTLFLSNHISYLDIFALSSKVPGYFIAKSEVAGWPVFGRLAKMQNTLFFERKSTKVHAQLSVMAKHFDENKNLILFPEGTSTDGVHVEPFKSSLLQSIEKAESDVIIQPISIAYTHYQGKLMTKNIRDQYAWYATMPFGPHFFHALGLKKSSVKIIFHAPIKLTDFESRKKCAVYCYDQVSAGLIKANMSL